MAGRLYISGACDIGVGLKLKKRGHCMYMNPETYIPCADGSVWP